MNRVFVLLMILGLAGGLWHAQRTFFPTRAQQAAALAANPVPLKITPVAQVRGPAVDVFGRTGCGFTRRMLTDLQSAGIPVRYYDIDVPAIEAQFDQRFRHAGLLRNGMYEPPIVEVGGRSYARPSSESVAYRFRNR